LRHIERTRLLVHLVDPSPETGREPLKDWQVINSELAEYRAGLENKPQVVAMTKMDVLPDPSRYQDLENACQQQGTPLHRISAVTGEGVAPLLQTVWEKLRACPDETAVPAAEAAPMGGAARSD
jgi:GTP-binding protein